MSSWARSPASTRATTVELEVKREGEPVTELSVGTRAAQDDPERAVMGVEVGNAEDFDFPVDIQIDAGGIGGPSAGLAFALDITDELGEDIDRGRTIVATGELGLDGTVHPIGGVEQKAIGARDAGADIFLVPDGNFEEARERGRRPPRRPRLDVRRGVVSFGD